MARVTLFIGSGGGKSDTFVEAEVAEVTVFSGSGSGESDTF